MLKPTYVINQPGEKPLEVFEVNRVKIFFGDLPTSEKAIYYHFPGEDPIIAVSEWLKTSSYGEGPDSLIPTLEALDKKVQAALSLNALEPFEVKCWFGEWKWQVQVIQFKIVEAEAA